METLRYDLKSQRSQTETKDVGTVVCSLLILITTKIVDRNELVDGDGT